MSYENAETTLFLATHCAVCGRPLVDADSVHHAVGPDCRKRYGHGTPTKPADFVAVRTILVNFGAELVTADPDLLTTEDANRVANVLLHRYAREYKTAKWIPDALHALGYDALAERAAKRARVKLGDVTAPPPPAPVATGTDVCIQPRTDRWTWQGREYTREVLTVATPKDEGFIALVRNIPGRRWDSEARVWTVPMDQKPALWTAVRTRFAGAKLVSDKGTTVIPAIPPSLPPLPPPEQA